MVMELRSPSNMSHNSQRTSVRGCHSHCCTHHRDMVSPVLMVGLAVSSNRSACLHNRCVARWCTHTGHPYNGGHHTVTHLAYTALLPAPRLTSCTITGLHRRLWALGVCHQHALVPVATPRRQQRQLSCPEGRGACGLPVLCGLCRHHLHKCGGLLHAGTAQVLKTEARALPGK